MLSRPDSKTRYRPVSANLPPPPFAARLANRMALRTLQFGPDFNQRAATSRANRRAIRFFPADPAEHRFRLLVRHAEHRRQREGLGRAGKEEVLSHKSYPFGLQTDMYDF